MTQEELEQVRKTLQQENPNMPLLFKELKISLSAKEYEDMTNKILEMVLQRVKTRPTPIKNVTLLKDTYKEGVTPTAEQTGYLVLYLIEENEKDYPESKGHLYYYDLDTLLWTKSITYEDSAAIEELKANKTDVKMLNWGFGPEEVTTKKEFYSKVGQVFVNKPTQSIYMYGEPEQLNAHFFDIWGKPEGFKATHAFISIRPLSNEHSRVSFKMYLNSSNYGTTYEMAVSGYAGAYVGDTGWRNLKALEFTKESTTAEANTIAVRQSDGALFAVTNPNPDDMELTNFDFVRDYVAKNKTDAFDIEQMIYRSGEEFNPLNPVEQTVIVDFSQENPEKLEVHLDKMFLDTLSVETQLTTKIPRGNHAYGLDRLELLKLKGIRIWINFEYNGTYNAYLHQDIYFPKISTVNPSYFGTPIPNPYLFSEKIIPVVDTTANSLEVKLISTGGSIDQKIKIVDVIGLL